jgi:hypothetical protein
LMTMVGLTGFFAFAGEASGSTAEGQRRPSPVTRQRKQALLCMKGVIV